MSGATANRRGATVRDLDAWTARGDGVRGRRVTGGFVARLQFGPSHDFARGQRDARATGRTVLAVCACDGAVAPSGATVVDAAAPEPADAPTGDDVLRVAVRVGGARPLDDRRSGGA